MMMARPTTTSQAATTMVKNAIIWAFEMAMHAREGDERQVNGHSATRRT